MFALRPHLEPDGEDAVKFYEPGGHTKGDKSKALVSFYFDRTARVCYLFPQRIPSNLTPSY